MIGRTLGRYEIVRQLGAGGMGVVYAARDTELEREVAIKVLPPELADRYEARAARFEREAKAIAALAHPNICTLYDVGHDDGTRFLVMELIDGESLADRLTRGPLPLDEVFRYGAEIADALDRAHRKSIVHRDLKPGNVMLTKMGAKLLDFGIAQVRSASPEELRSLSTAPEPLTGDGEILGTFRYMAPEQLEGKQADARTDIFALGVLLYEMATGTSAFEGTSRASLIAAILSGEPRSVRELQPLTPPVLEHVIRRCLEKDPDNRWQSARDIANELRWATEPALNAEGDQPRQPRTRPWQLAAVAAVALFAGAYGMWLGTDRQPVERAPRPVTVVPRLVRLTWERGTDRLPSISPDGASFVYAHDREGKWGGTVDTTDIYLRRIGGENPINLTESHVGNAYGARFSPDGSMIAFNSGGIFLMGASGESIRRLTDEGIAPAWSPDGKTIVYISGRGGIWGGKGDRSLVTVDVATGERRMDFETDVIFNPCWSPSGNRIAFTRRRASSLGGVETCSILATGGGEVCVVSGSSVLSLPGLAWQGEWLWFWSATAGPHSLWRMRIDEESGARLGKAEIVFRGTEFAQDLSISSDGRKVLFTALAERDVTVRYPFDPVHGLVDPEPETVVDGGRGIYLMGGPSPDGEWLSTFLVDHDDEEQQDIVLVRASTGETRRLTDDGFREERIVWAPDGSRLYFCISPGETSEVWSIRPDGSDREKVVPAIPGRDIERVVPSPDGRLLYFALGSRSEPHVIDITVPIDARKPTPLPPMPDGRSFFIGSLSRWSPDGRLLLGYQMNEEGEIEWELNAFDSVSQTYIRIAPLAANYRVSWLPDSRRLLLARGGELQVLDRITGKISPAGSAATGNAVLSSDGRWLYANMLKGYESQNIWMLDFGDMVQGPGNEAFTEPSP